MDYIGTIRGLIKGILYRTLDYAVIYSVLGGGVAGVFHITGMGKIPACHL